MSSTEKNAFDVYKSINKDLTTLSNSSTVEDVQLVYDKWATNYDKNNMDAGYTGPTYFVDAFGSMLSQIGWTNKGIKILDLAAGTGLLGAELHKWGFTNLDALDVSQGMLDEAKKKNVYKKLICAPLGGAQTPGIEAGQYDAVVLSAAFAIGHVKPEAVNEIIRIVKPGGLVSFSIRKDQLVHYEGKFKEMEEDKTWKLIGEDTIVYFDSPAARGMPFPETVVFFGYAKCS